MDERMIHRMKESEIKKNDGLLPGQITIEGSIFYATGITFPRGMNSNHMTGWYYIDSNNNELYISKGQ